MDFGIIDTVNFDEKKNRSPFDGRFVFHQRSRGEFAGESQRTIFSTTWEPDRSGFKSSSGLV